MPDQNPRTEERPSAAAASETPRPLPTALSQSEEPLRLTIDGVQDFAIFALDTEGRILSRNPGVGRLPGYEEAEVGRPGVGRRHLSLLRRGASGPGKQHTESQE